MNHRVVYLSPHPDDVAFSCGGSVAQDVSALGSQNVTVVTVFSKTHDEEVRKAEDLRAMEILGATLLRLDLPDGLLRPEVRGRLDLFSPLGTRHLGITSEVVSRLTPHVPEGTTLVAPLGIGGHLDHRLTFVAARALAEVRKIQLCFYEELPYSLARYSLGRRLATLEASVETKEATPGLGRSTVGAEIVAYHKYLASMPLGLRLGPPGIRWIPMRLAARAAVHADRKGDRPGPPPKLRPEVRDVSAHKEARIRAMTAYKTQWPLFSNVPKGAVPGSEDDPLRDAFFAYGASLLPTGLPEGQRGPLFERRWHQVDSCVGS